MRHELIKSARIDLLESKFSQENKYKRRRRHAHALHGAGSRVWVPTDHDLSTMSTYRSSDRRSRRFLRLQPGSLPAAAASFTRVHPGDTCYWASVPTACRGQSFAKQEKMTRRTCATPSRSRFWKTRVNNKSFWRGTQHIHEPMSKPQTS